MSVMMNFYKKVYIAYGDMNKLYNICNGAHSVVTYQCVLLNCGGHFEESYLTAEAGINDQM
jgi:hypothetical protein